MNPFELYAKQAQTIVNSPARLIGPTATRAEARNKYNEIVGRIASIKNGADLSVYLEEISQDVAQFHAELPFLWDGDGDFLGLRKEIERAQVRFDERLDYPRYDPAGDAGINEKD